jgi:hypothetical protein
MKTLLFLTDDYIGNGRFLPIYPLIAQDVCQGNGRYLLQALGEEGQTIIKNNRIELYAPV